MSKSQIDTFVYNIKKYGFMYEDDIINHFTKKGNVMDKGLIVARVMKINKNPQKHGFPKGMGIGSRPLKVDGRTKRMYTTVFLDTFQHVDARKVQGMKEIYTKAA